MSRWLAALTLGLVLLSAPSAIRPALAHEVQPAVLNLTLGPESARLELEASVEPMIAGADLDGLADTDDSTRAAEIDRLRRLPPARLEAALRAAWPGIAADLGLAVAGAPVPVELRDIAAAPVGDPDLPRLTRITAQAALPPGDAAVTVSWAPRLGALVVRQMPPARSGAAVDPGTLYTGYLSGGAESEPIMRRGGAAETWLEALVSYIPVGTAHIVPLGLDHILFVLGLFFLSPRPGPLLWQVTAFTAAHTVTLALAALGVLRVPASVVEPLIAASIVYVGVENVLARRLTPWRPVVVLLFGLLHGLGFAGVLSEYGLGETHFTARLIGFNIGVELGQLLVIAIALALVGAAIGSRRENRPLAYGLLVLALVGAPGAMALVAALGLGAGLLPLIAAAAVLLGLTGATLAAPGAGPDRYRLGVAHPASVLIALAGAYWCVERVFL